MYANLMPFTDDLLIAVHSGFTQSSGGGAALTPLMTALRTREVAVTIRGSPEAASCSNGDTLLIATGSFLSVTATRYSENLRYSCCSSNSRSCESSFLFATFCALGSTRAAAGVLVSTPASQS